MQSAKTRNKTILITSIAIILVGACFGFIHSKKANNETQSQLSSSQKCPENYSTDVDRNAEYKSFITDFLIHNPQGTVASLAQTRIDFLTKNNCTQTLKYIQDNGGIEQYIKTIMTDLMATDTPATYTTINSKYIPNTSLSFARDYFDDSSRLSIVSVSPKTGFATGIAQYPTLKWQTKYIHKEAPLIGLDVEYPSFTSGDTLTDFKLNQYIESIIAGIVKDDQTRLGDQAKLKKIVALAPNDEFESSLDLTMRYRVLGVTHGIVSFEMVATDFTGGGNGDHDYPYTINWDLKSNRLLNPSDIFCSSDYINILMPLARKQLVVDFENDPYITVHPIPESFISWINDGTKNDPNNWQHFLLHNTGVIAVFPPYQVSDGGSGIVRTFIAQSKDLPFLCLP